MIAQHIRDGDEFRYVHTRRRKDGGRYSEFHIVNNGIKVVAGHERVVGRCQHFDARIDNVIRNNLLALAQDTLALNASQWLLLLFQVRRNRAPHPRYFVIFLATLNVDATFRHLQLYSEPRAVPLRRPVWRRHCGRWSPPHGCGCRRGSRTVVLVFLSTEQAHGVNWMLGFVLLSKLGYFSGRG